MKAHAEDSKKRTKKEKQTKDEKEAMKDVELALSKQYPRIVAGSIAAAGSHEAFGNKRTVKIKCEDCDKERRIATSDLHQCTRCEDCMRQHRLQKRKDAKAAKKPKRRKKEAPEPEMAGATA